MSKRSSKTVIFLIRRLTVQHLIKLCDGGGCPLMKILQVRICFICSSLMTLSTSARPRCSRSQRISSAMVSQLSFWLTFFKISFCNLLRRLSMTSDKRASPLTVENNLNETVLKNYFVSSYITASYGANKPF